MSDAGGDDGCDELHAEVDWLMDAILLTLVGGIASLIVSFFFWRRGAFDDIEDVKYELFRNE
jgi:hypothetical protein